MTDRIQKAYRNMQILLVELQTDQYEDDRLTIWQKKAIVMIDAIRFMEVDLVFVEGGDYYELLQVSGFTDNKIIPKAIGPCNSNTTAFLRMRKHNEFIDNPTVVLTDDKYRDQLLNSYNGINCILETNLKKAVRMLENGLGDAGHLDGRTINEYRLDNMRQFYIDWIDAKAILPVYCSGMDFLLGYTGFNESNDFYERVSDTRARICYEIEEEIILKSKFEKKLLGVYAYIVKDKLHLLIYAGFKDARYKISVSDSLNHRTLIVKRALEKLEAL